MTKKNKKENQALDAMEQVTYDDDTKQEITKEVTKFKINQYSYGSDFSMFSLFRTTYEEEQYEKLFKNDYDTWRKKERKSGCCWIGIHSVGLICSLIFSLGAVHQMVCSNECLEKQSKEMDPEHKMTPTQLRIQGGFMTLWGVGCCGFTVYRGYKNAQKIYVMRPPKVKVNGREYC